MTDTSSEISGIVHRINISLGDGKARMIAFIAARSGEGTSTVAWQFAEGLDTDGIGWMLWDYTDLFGITRLQGKITRPDPIDGAIRLADPGKGSRVFEPEALKALGLIGKP